MMRRFFTVVRIKHNNERTPGGNHDEVRMWHFIALATHRVNLIGHKRHGSIELTNRCNDHAQLLRPPETEFQDSSPGAGNGCSVVVSFPKPKGGSGFPARVFAILPEDED